MTIFRILALITSVTLLPFAAFAAETTTYVYDAQGRLVQVVKTGSVNNGISGQYSYDKAGNRVSVKVTGSPNGNGA